MTNRIAIENVRVFDGNELTAPTTVVIDGTRIGADADGAEVVDGQGGTLLPGLIDAHVHITNPQELAQLASWGVTTGLDMACWPTDRVASLRAVTGFADFRTAGLPAIGPGGPHSCIPNMPTGAIINTAADARAHVEARMTEEVDYIKGIAEAPGAGGPPLEALSALVSAAREYGKKSVIHAASAGAYDIAVQAGADFITHLPIDGPVNPESLTAMKNAGQTAVPTTTMMSGILAGRAPIDGVLANLRAVADSGIAILAGTDSNAQQGVPAQIRHGSSLHEEFGLMSRAGMRPLDILRSATILSAEAFGLTDRGTIAVGKRADLVLLDGDPLADIAATTAIRAVWCGGVKQSNIKV